MKRKAVLIESSNVAGQKDLAGARVDIRNWNNYLKSELGGAWLDSEIVILNKPWSKDVEAALTVDYDCYCFIAFSGHGNDGSICLNDSYLSFPTSKLKPKTEKSTLIIDSCRGVEEAKEFTFNRKIAMINEASGVVTALNALEGRSTIFASETRIYNRSIQFSNAMTAWEAALKKSSAGLVEMLSCAKGEEAGDDPDSGGYYTSLLLHSAESWNNRTTINMIHTTKDAHDYAVGLIPPQQKPEYNPSWLTFPFAVKV